MPSRRPGVSIGERLNRIPGVDLPAAKIELRPTFPLEVLADPHAMELFTDAIDWFHQQAARQEPQSEPVR